MTITRTQAEQELVSRAKNKMSMVGMTVTTAGTNASLDSPLATALRKMGLSASATVSNADLTALSIDQIDEFYDRAELRLLENIYNNFDLANMKHGGRWEDFKDLVQTIEKRITQLRETVASTYGEGGSTLTGGYIGLDFAEKLDDEVDA